MTDVSAGFRPPCWCPCTWAPAWRLHTNLYKFGENVSSHIFHEKNCCDLNLGESLCICTFFLVPDSGINLLNGFDFLFWSILNGVTLKTSNSKAVRFFFRNLSTGLAFIPKRLLSSELRQEKCTRCDRFVPQRRSRNSNSEEQRRGNLSERRTGEGQSEQSVLLAWYGYFDVK